MNAINLMNNIEYSFDEKTAPIYAVCYAYCEENLRLSWFFNHCHSNTLENAYKELPIITGKNTIACGDWAAKLN